MHEPTWLSRELVLRIHDRQLLEHGGTTGLRDAGLLDSALARPRQVHAYDPEEGDIPGLAAAYAVAISRNHPFLDGNKRTSAVACELFLELNGWTLVAEDAELYPVYMAVAAGEMEHAELAAWLRDRARPQNLSEPRGEYA